MKTHFESEEAWLRGIAAAVREGLTFEAWPPCLNGPTWVIEYTGGY